MNHCASTNLLEEVTWHRDNKFSSFDHIPPINREIHFREKPFMDDLLCTLISLWASLLDTLKHVHQELMEVCSASVRLIVHQTQLHCLSSIYIENSNSIKTVDYNTHLNAKMCSLQKRIYSNLKEDHNVRHWLMQ